MSLNPSYFPRWTVRTSGVIAPDERLPLPQTLALGLQHVVAMFGATVLAPLLMGFDPNVAILFSGVGTLIFFVLVGGRVPSYLGSSFAFIAVALGGIIAAGIVYSIIAAIVMLAGYGWIDRVMPPVVTGSVVAVIGLNLAPIAVKSISGSTLDTWIGIATILAVGLIAVRAPGLAGRLPVLLGGLAGYLLHAVCTNGLGLGKPIDFSGVANAAWIGWPHLMAPVFNGAAVALIAPVAVVLVAENLGHIKAVAAMTGRNLDPYLGRAFLGDGLATIVAGMGGGSGVTTYAENIGVMAVTKIYSTLLFVVAACVALVLGFSPKFGALIMTIPGSVLGGLSIVVFGLITATGGRIWVENRVDFSRARNFVTAAVTLTIGAGDLALKLGGFTLGGIGTATFGAILLYQLFRDRDGA